MKRSGTGKGKKKRIAGQLRGADQNPSSKDAVQALKALQVQLDAVVADQEDRKGILTPGQQKRAQKALDETAHAISILECIQGHSPYR